MNTLNTLNTRHDFRITNNKIRENLNATRNVHLINHNLSNYLHFSRERSNHRSVTFVTFPLVRSTLRVTCLPIVFFFVTSLSDRSANKSFTPFSSSKSPPSNVGKCHRDFVREVKTTTETNSRPLGREQSALPRSMIGNLQKSPAVSSARIYVVTRPYKCTGVKWICGLGKVMQESGG